MFKSTLLLCVNGIFVIVLGIFFDDIKIMLGINSNIASIMFIIGLTLLLSPILLRNEIFFVNKETNKKILFLFNCKSIEIITYQQRRLLGIIPIEAPIMIESIKKADSQLSNELIVNGKKILPLLIPIVNAWFLSYQDKQLQNKINYHNTYRH